MDKTVINKQSNSGAIKVFRQLDNGQKVEWECFWDNGWFDFNDGVRIPNVIRRLDTPNQ